MFKALKLSEIAVFRDFKIAEEQLDPRINVQQRLEAESIRDLLLKLPAHQRELLVLYEYEELSTEEIARLQNTSPGSVRVRLFRARQRLKEIALLTFGEGNKDAI
jgi:RNA polymerase sigma-70 factor (ECF subfamily)